MKLSFFALIALSFPNGDIRFSQFGAEVYDRNNEMIGYIPNRELFVLVEEYTHAEMARQALEENGVNFEVRGSVDALYS